jgi:hypothetical protein
MAVFIKDNLINNKPNQKKIGNVSICFPTSKEDKNKASCTNGGIGNYFYIHLNPSVVTTQLSSVVPRFAPRMIAIAFLMVNTQPHKRKSTIKDTMELL